MAFVQCRRCFSLLLYDPRKIGTLSFSTHAKSCHATQPNSDHNFMMMFSGPTTSNVSGKTKRLATEALAEMCAKDIRPFETVAGAG